MNKSFLATSGHHLSLKDADIRLTGEILQLSRANEDAVWSMLRASPDGLDAAEATARLASGGHNLIAKEGRPSMVGELWGRARNPLNALLLSLAAVSYFLGDFRAAIVILIMVVLAITTAFIQEHRSNDAAAKLRAMVKTTASVKRRGAAIAAAEDLSQGFAEIAIDQLVPGDIVRLSAGDMIPADLRLISAKDLFVNQAALTGEAMPSEKSASPPDGEIADPFGLPNLCFMGASVVSGFGVGVIAHTGAKTYFGQLADQIAGQRELTSFDKGINRFTWLMIRFMHGDGAGRFPDQRLHQGGLARGAFIRGRGRGRPDAGNAADDRHRQSRQGRDGDVEKAGDREAPSRHPEFRRDGCLVHRQDGHADAGPHHSQTAPRHSRQ